MSFTREQLEDIEGMMDDYIQHHRPPEHIRKQLDIGWRMENQSVILYFEIRPRRNVSSEKYRCEYAKASWIHRQTEWYVYWLLSNMKWQRYEGLESAFDLQRFLLEVEKDPLGCFHGGNENLRI